MHKPLGNRNRCVGWISHSKLKLKLLQLPNVNVNVEEAGRKTRIPNFQQIQVSQYSTFSSSSSEVYAGKGLQIQIVQALSAGRRKTASHLLSLLPQTSPHNNFLYILNHCAASPDPLFVMETWKTMEAHRIPLNDYSYLLLIKSLCKAGYLQQASNFMNYLQETRGIFPSLRVYNTFLHACAEMQNMEHANQCLDFMDHQMVGKNEVTYNEILKLAVWQQNLSAVHQLWKDYIKNYSLSLIALRKFIWSFTRLEDVKSAYETLQHMVGLAISERLSVDRTSAGKLGNSRMDIPIPFSGESASQKVRMGETEFSVTLEKNTRQCSLDIRNIEAQAAKMGSLSKHRNKLALKLLRWSFSDVIHACAQAKNGKLAERLMEQMLNLGLRPSNHTYDGFVRAVVSQRGSNFGMKVLETMKQKGLKPYDPTLATLSIACSQALKLDLAESLLDQMSECPYPHPHNALLAACDAMDQHERALRILAKMKQLKLKPDILTYELLFSLFGNVNAPYEFRLSPVDCAKRINAIEIDMMKNNIQHSHLSMKNLLKALAKSGMIKELMQYSSVAVNLFSRNRTPIYNTVLHSLVDAKEIHLAIKIFKSMKPCAVPANAATYTKMIDCCSIIGSYKSALGIVSMMLRDGFYPDTLTYTTLIKILLKLSDFDGALNLLDQASSDRVQPDVLLYNTFLWKACEEGRIDVIEFIIEQMRQKEVLPDATTCRNVFSAYVGRGFHSTAVEALQVLSLRMIGEEDSILEEKRIEYEDLIFSEDPKADTRILELFKGYEDNLAIALLSLRWTAILGYQVIWSPDQSAWTKRLSATYNPRRRIR